MMHNTRELLAEFDQHFRAKFHVPAPITKGKDGQIARWLLNMYTPDEIRMMFDAFFASRDPFILKAGYSLGVFRACLSKLISQSQPRQVRAMPVCVRCKRVDVARLGDYCQGCRELVGLTA